MKTTLTKNKTTKLLKRRYNVITGYEKIYRVDYTMYYDGFFCDKMLLGGVGENKSINLN